MQAVDRQKGDLQFLVLVYSERLQYYEACSYKQLTRLEKKKKRTRSYITHISCSQRIATLLAREDETFVSCIFVSDQKK